MYLGQNAFMTALSPAEAAVAISDAAMQSALPEGEILEGRECPPLDCSKCPVKIVEKQVFVPGPATTQVVYRDRYITQPGASTINPVTGLPYTQDELAMLPIVSIPAASGVPITPVDSVTPEETEMSEGVVEMADVKKFPWLWVVLGGGAIWFLSQRK